MGCAVLAGLIFDVGNGSFNIPIILVLAMILIMACTWSAQVRPRGREIFALTVTYYLVVYVGGADTNFVRHGII